MLVGTLEVSVPSHVEGNWKAHERYMFGMTEIEVSARVKTTNQTFETTFSNNIFEEKFAVGVTKKWFFFSKMKCNITYDEFKKWWL